MNLKDVIIKLQVALNERGAKLVLDGDPGDKTQAALEPYDAQITLTPHPKPNPQAPNPNKADSPPWYQNLQSMKGKVESDPEFQAKMNPFWKAIGLPGFKGLVGSARAWCALAVFAVLTTAGYKTGQLNASAISGDHVGQTINWKVDGIPRGAVVRINHEANCKETKDSHIALSDGDCAPQDLIQMVKGADGVWKMAGDTPKLIAGSTINLLGGNQGNMVKVSAFPVAHICTVSWPSKDEAGKAVPLPGKILKSDHCTGAATPAESTK